MVCGPRRFRCGEHNGQRASALRFQPALCRFISVQPRHDWSCNLGCGVFGRHGGRSTLCRPRAFWGEAHSRCLVICCAAEPVVELSWPRCPFVSASGNNRKSILPDDARLGLVAHGVACRCGHDHCQPGRHHRCLFDDAASRAAGPVATHAHRIHIGVQRRPNLHAANQLAFVDRRGRIGPRLQKLFKPCHGLWHRRYGHHGGDGSSRHVCHQEPLEMVLAGNPRADAAALDH